MTQLCKVVSSTFQFGITVRSFDFVSLLLSFVSPFDYTAVVVSWNVGIPLTCLTTPVGWLSSIQTDSPKSVRNRC